MGTDSSSCYSTCSCFQLRRLSLRFEENHEDCSWICSKIWDHWKQWKHFVNAWVSEPFQFTVWLKLRVLKTMMRHINDVFICVHALFFFFLSLSYLQHGRSAHLCQKKRHTFFDEIIQFLSESCLMLTLFCLTGHFLTAVSKKHVCVYVYDFVDLFIADCLRRRACFSGKTLVDLCNV